MKRLPLTIRRRAAGTADIAAAPTTACFAPSVQLVLEPDGRVRPCGVHQIGFGNIGDKRHSGIWAGVQRQQLVDHLARNDYSAGCENCEAEIAMEGRENSYAEFFVRRATHLTGDTESGRWPRWIDFNLSTSCNLQCVQCSGELSSSIRIHRERRDPLPNPYGEEFFEDLRRFIPHLDGAQFAGG